MSDQKHYVLLEYIPIHPDNVQDIPWPDLLTGAVNVTNFKHIDQNALVTFGRDHGVAQILSEAEGQTFEDVHQALNEANNAGFSQVPDEILIVEKFENYSVDELLEEIDEISDDVIGAVVDFLQIDREAVGFA